MEPTVKIEFTAKEVIALQGELARARSYIMGQIDLATSYVDRGIDRKCWLNAIDEYRDRLAKVDRLSAKVKDKVKEVCGNEQ